MTQENHQAINVSFSDARPRFRHAGVVNWYKLEPSFEEDSSDEQ
jgi:hypothetical protein